MPERAAPCAWPEDMAGRPSPQGANPDSASAVSSPSDPAAAGNDAGAPTAPTPGGEGEPHSRQRDARLGSTDKELKAGTTAEGSTPTALGNPWQREPGVKAMDPGLWGPSGKGYRRVPSLPVWCWLDKREGLGTLERHYEEARSRLAGAKDGGVKGVPIPPGVPHWRPPPLAVLYCINGPSLSGTTFPPVPPA